MIHGSSTSLRMHFLFVSVLSFSFPLTCHNLPCPTNWVPYGSSQTCIKVQKGNLNFWDSSYLCREETANIVTVTSILELQQLQKQLLATNISTAWIGLSNVFSSHQIFHWLSGYPAVLTDFLTDPHNLTSNPDVQGCVHLSRPENESQSDYLWSVEDCNEYKTSVICQLSSTNKTTETSLLPPLAKGSCPLQFFRVENFCYHVYNATTQGFGWTRANQECQKLHNTSQLATIHNRQVQEFFTAYAATMQWDAWIGLSAVSGMGYRWSRGDQVTYSHWESGKALKASLNSACVAMRVAQTEEQVGLWHSERCDHPLAYICEADLQADDKASPSNISNDLLRNPMLTPSPKSSCKAAPPGGGIVFEYQSSCMYFNTQQQWPSFHAAWNHCRTDWHGDAAPVLLRSLQDMSLVHTLMLINMRSHPQVNTIHAVWLNVRARRVMNSSDIEVQWGTWNESQSQLESVGLKHSEVYQRIRLDHLPTSGEWQCFVLTLNSKSMISVPCVTAQQHNNNSSSNPLQLPSPSLLCTYSLKSHPFHNLSAVLASTQCPPGTQFEVGSLCLIGSMNVTSPVVHYEATKRCMVGHQGKPAGALLSISNREMQNLLHKVIKQNATTPMIWLEMKFSWNYQQDKVTGVKEWYLDVPPVLMPTYLHFAPGEPKSQGMQNCVAMNVSSGLWYSVACTQRLGYLCSVLRVPVVTTTPKPMPKCAAGFSYHRGMCYTIIRANVNFNGARQACQRLHVRGSLASIHSMQTNQFILTLVRGQKKPPSSSQVWLGLKTVSGRVNAWEDRSPQSFQDFSEEDVDDGEDDEDMGQDVFQCLALDPNKNLAAGQWIHKSCELILSGAVCEYSLDGNQITPGPTGPISRKHITDVNYVCNWEYQLYDGLCYRVVREMRTWKQAQERCAHLSPNGSLAVVEHEQHNLFLYSMLEKALFGDLVQSLWMNKQNNSSSSLHAQRGQGPEMRFWMGILWHGSNQTVSRIDEGSVYFTNWNWHKVSKLHKDSWCGALHGHSLLAHGGEWLPLQCNLSLPFLCQAPLIHNSKLPVLNSRGRHPLPEHGRSSCLKGYVPFQGATGMYCYRLLNGEFTAREAEKHCPMQNAPVATNGTHVARDRTSVASLSLYSAYEWAFLRAWLFQKGLSWDRDLWLGLKEKPPLAGKVAPGAWYWTTGDGSHNPGEEDLEAGVVRFPLWGHSLNVTRTPYHDNICYALKWSSGTSPEENGVDRLTAEACNDESVKNYVVCKYTALSVEQQVLEDGHDYDTRKHTGTLESALNYTTYLGYRNYTKSMRSCVRWDMISDVQVSTYYRHQFYLEHQRLLSALSSSESVHKLARARREELQRHIIYNGLATAANFCRNPNNAAKRPFCYVTTGDGATHAQNEDCSLEDDNVQGSLSVGRGSSSSHSFLSVFGVLLLLSLCVSLILAGLCLLYRRRQRGSTRAYISYRLHTEEEAGGGDLMFPGKGSQRLTDSATTSFHNPIYTPLTS